MNREIRLQGYPICPGIAIGRPFLFSAPEEDVPEFLVADDKIQFEVDRYYQALRRSRKDLMSLQRRMLQEGGEEAADILGSHIEIMRDPIMTVKVEQAIRSEGKNTEYVFKSVMGEVEEKFQRITDIFFRERLKDFQDISRRIISHLRQKERCTLKQLAYRCIVFAHELSPSDTAEANTDVIDAFVTRSGAETSHVAIMARAKGIPFVTNVDFPVLCTASPPQIIVDGGSGLVIINPTGRTLQEYREFEQKQRQEVEGLCKSSLFSAETIDGYPLRLSANIEMFKELDMLHQYGGEGVGLFRSEYLFLGKDSFPSEEEQFLVYKQLVEKVGNHTSVIRTFDIGGDKLGNFHLSRQEQNPYLGCRAIRLMLKERTLFKTQLRAILRASAFGEASILFPMISGLNELLEAKMVVETVKEELLAAGIPFNRTIPMGCMIEVPSAALICDILAPESSFLSIGTNDLVQYALAVDRGNSAMSYLYTPSHPSVLRLIKMVVDEGNRAGKNVSVCGEIAANPLYTELLIGLGVHELSVSTPALPVIKNTIRGLTIVGARELAEHVLTLSTPQEIDAALTAAFQKGGK